MNKKPQLSLVINTKNASLTLERTLRSAKEIADEIVIVDMQSTDDTVKLAKKSGAQVFVTDKDYGYVEPARNFAIQKTKGNWVLILDADEELSKTAREMIFKIINNEVEIPLQGDCYFIPRKNLILGKWLEKTGWWPDYQLRLFKKDSVEWSDKIHAEPKAKGVIIYLPAKEENAILHHNYQTISQFVQRLDRYTSLELRSSGKHTAVDREHAIGTHQVVRAFTGELIQRLFAQQGIDENTHGVSLSYLQAMYQVVSLLKSWEVQEFPDFPHQQLETIAELRHFQRELNYWIADWHMNNSTGLSRIYWLIRRKLQK
jgi:(heptosyl)LPS beta-1,4-glucosyltransferase